MKTYELIIKPQSGFATPLKGDTLFGHICWQAAYDDSLFGKPLKDLLADYSVSPFIVISSAYPRLMANSVPVYALKRPDMPLDSLFVMLGKDKKKLIRERKEIKAQNWMLVNDSEPVTSLRGRKFLSDEELFGEMRKYLPADRLKESAKKGMKSYRLELSQSHNSISRVTGTTGEGEFAPFSVEQYAYFPGTELSIFVGANRAISSAQIVTAFKRVGETGFGKDASTGLGKFAVDDIVEIDLSKIGSADPNACYTLSPSVPEKGAFEKMYFVPFTRFGKHGDVLAKSTNPFKNPVIMADEGAVLLAGAAVFSKPYIGTAVTGVSKAEPNTMMQGYSLYIPVRVEV